MASCLPSSLCLDKTCNNCEILAENHTLHFRKYNHLLCRAEYPAERGYRIEPEKLPDWLHLVIVEDENGNKWLLVHSRIHTQKEVKVGPTYSSEFNDSDLIKDLSGQISYMFL